VRGRAGVGGRLDLHEGFGVADVKVIKKPLLKLRRVKGSGDRAAPNLGVIG